MLPLRFSVAIHMYYSQVRLMEDHITLPERKGSQKRPAYAGATAQANDPVQNKFFCTKPASANVSSSNGGWAEIRVVIPSPHADKVKIEETMNENH